MMTNKILKYISKSTESVSLAFFRIFFGLLMFYSILRIWYRGWIDLIYIQPDYFFSYYGFSWVKPIGNYTYLIFIICAIASLMVAMGYKYRFAIITLFLSFTYIELMDKTYYLNHYYLVSLLCFIMCFLPANVSYSLDAFRKPNLRREFVPKFTVDILKFMLTLVYFYAGLAKLNSDWLFEAQPLKTWLAVKYDMFLVGELMRKEWFYYVMSWCGAFYDLTIAFFLMYKRTRLLAFMTVIFFHIFTWILFPIGMFPFIMITSTTIFFNADKHQVILDKMFTFFKLNTNIFKNGKRLIKISYQKLILTIFFIFCIVQVLFPFRYMLYPGELFWTEEGFCFSWRVKLIEKAGYAEFRIKDKDTGKVYYVDNNDYLTKNQIHHMSTQTDFILQYAHHLGDIYKRKGVKNPAVYVDNYVTLNGRLNTRFVKRDVDLYQIEDSFLHKNWIIPFSDPVPIKGF